MTITYNTISNKLENVSNKQCDMFSGDTTHTAVDNALISLQNTLENTNISENDMNNIEQDIDCFVDNGYQDTDFDWIETDICRAFRNS